MTSLTVIRVIRVISRRTVKNLDSCKSDQEDRRLNPLVEKITKLTTGQID